MTLWSDKKGMVNIATRWTTERNICCTVSKCFFLEELREAGLIKVSTVYNSQGKVLL